MDALGSSSQLVGTGLDGGRRCVFCLEGIRPGASVCPHCGSNLSPLQSLADKQTALEERIAALEHELAAQRTAIDKQAAVGDVALSAPTACSAPITSPDIRWPHMADNLFLGLTALLAAHWLATTLPANNRDVFRIVALIVALPFGYRFERNSRTGTSGQVLAALAFGSIGTLSIGMLDAAVFGRAVSAATAQDIAASGATIALSHYAGSALAHVRQKRTDRRAVEDAAERLAASSAADAGSLMHIEPARIKSTAEVVKAVYDAAAPVAAGAAALWAAFGHLIF